MLSRTSLMFLWELKNAIISTKSPWTLCYRNSKTKQKNSTHGGFDKLSHRVIYYYSRCLSLLKAVLIPPCDFVNFVRRLSVCAQSPYYLLLHSVPERSRRHILNSHLGAWACRRHIISILLKSVCFLEHLWCSFGSSKTALFHKISVNFVILILLT